MEQYTPSHLAKWQAESHKRLVRTTYIGAFVGGITYTGGTLFSASFVTHSIDTTEFWVRCLPLIAIAIFVGFHYFFNLSPILVGYIIWQSIFISNLIQTLQNDDVYNRFIITVLSNIPILIVPALIFFWHHIHTIVNITLGITINTVLVFLFHKTQLVNYLPLWLLMFPIAIGAVIVSWLRYEPLRNNFLDTLKLQQLNADLQESNRTILEKQEMLELKQHELLKTNQTLEKQKAEIQKQRDDLTSLNEELHSQQEELRLLAEHTQQVNTNLNIRNVEISKQHDELKFANEQTARSLNYAQRIQQALLPLPEEINKYVRDFFVLFIPRDVVSGDFYWFKEVNHNLMFAVADCTGHGVPGAFMSMLGIAFLNEIVRRKEIIAASQVLEILRTQIKTALKQTGRYGEQEDGMDIAFISIDKLTLQMQFSGAHNSLYIVREDAMPLPEDSAKIKTWIYEQTMLIELKPDLQPIGIYKRENPFTNHVVQLYHNDNLYIHTDGYTDQLGSEDKRTKYTTRRLRQFLLDNYQLPMQKQQHELLNEFIYWKSDYEQIDDVLVLGIRL